MTGMGTFLATVVLAVPLAAWLNGTFLMEAPQLGLARIPPAPRGIRPKSWGSNIPVTPTSLGWTR
ncbi:MAG: hypothetical protein ACM37Z_11180 [Deltaproteobacteria bacterium]